jgi:predicted ATPase
MPQVELIIGPQPPAAHLPPDQAQHRLHAVFQKFVGVFTTADHPLVLFLDDLQWIDSGSLTLLTQLSSGSATPYLLLLGAYRDNEVSAAHPLMIWLETLRKTASVLEAITLAPLAQGHVTAIVADTLRCEVEEAAALAQLVFEKTRGNPFFCFQFLTALFQDGLLAFDPETRRWTWDVAAIDARNFTDNVVELMLGELQRLPPPTQKALTFAGFLGNEFALDRLALVLGKPVDATTDVLWPALMAGLYVRRDCACVSSTTASRKPPTRSRRRRKERRSTRTSAGSCATTPRPMNWKTDFSI